MYVAEAVSLTAYLVWGFMGSLGIILPVHQYGKFKFSLAIPT